jgi:hypothetical protein
MRSLWSAERDHVDANCRSTSLPANTRPGFRSSKTGDYLSAERHPGSISATAHGTTTNVSAHQRGGGEPYQPPVNDDRPGRHRGHGVGLTSAALARAADAQPGPARANAGAGAGRPAVALDRIARPPDAHARAPHSHVAAAPPAPGRPAGPRHRADRSPVEERCHGCRCARAASRDRALRRAVAPETVRHSCPCVPRHKRHQPNRATTTREELAAARRVLASRNQCPRLSDSPEAAVGCADRGSSVSVANTTGTV